jgi:hypothetical protein
MSEERENYDASMFPHTFIADVVQTAVGNKYVGPVDDYGNLYADATVDAARRELCAPLLERIAELEAALSATDAELKALLEQLGEADAADAFEGE